MSTFSPIGSGPQMVCLCVCGWNELEVCTTLAYIHVSVHSIPCQCYTHTRILRPFEDSKPTGVKVDTAQEGMVGYQNSVLPSCLHRS